MEEYSYKIYDVSSVHLEEGVYKISDLQEIINQHIKMNKLLSTQVDSVSGKVCNKCYGEGGWWSSLDAHNEEVEYYTKCNFCNGTGNGEQTSKHKQDGESMDG